MSFAGNGHFSGKPAVEFLADGLIKAVFDGMQPVQLWVIRESAGEGMDKRNGNDEDLRPLRIRGNCGKPQVKADDRRF